MTASDLPTTPDDPRLKGWYHTIDLGGGMVTEGAFDHRPVVDSFGLPESLAGKEVLDVGTADGFFAFEMERRGAERVVALDLARTGDCDWVPRMRHRLADGYDNAAWPSRFRMAHAMRGSNVDYRFGSVYDLSPYTVGTFDLVFCGSLLIHLQNPLGALHAIRSVTRETAIIEVAVEAALEEHLSDRPLVSFGYPAEEDEPGQFNSYWVFTTTAIRRMLAYADFPVTEHIGSFALPPMGLRVTAVAAHVG
jgi:tRNA (mo5U34)-methyltransferase